MKLKRINPHEILIHTFFYVKITLQSRDSLHKHVGNLLSETVIYYITPKILESLRPNLVKIPHACTQINLTLFDLKSLYFKGYVFK